MTREIYSEFIEEEKLPEIESADRLRRLISPTSVFVMAHPKGGQTRLGFEFACSWDDEHGLGVSTHQGKVVAIGGAEEAFSECFSD